jgi:ABC-2 type transport system ATP-binding protein
VSGATRDGAGVSAATIGGVAASNNLGLHELTTVTGSLEDAYLRLTADEVEYQTQAVEAEVVR